MKSSLFQPILIAALLITLPIGCGSGNEPTFKLVVSASPTEGGSISPTEGVFDKNVDVVLNATPSNEWIFVRWEGDWSASVNPTTVRMTRDYTIIGVFERKKYALTVNVEGEGTVTENIVTAKSTEYPFDTVVELTPVAAMGWGFKEWGGDLSGSQSPARITVSGPKSVIAKFEEVAVVDIDGNLYPIVRIGTQEWMKTNLRTSRYRDGSVIPNSTSNSEWGISQGAWAFYDNDPDNGAVYGKLYNGFAVTDTRGLCPVGWHVPSDAEWTTLANYLGTDAGFKMKSATGWLNNGNGSDESGFTGLPGGYRTQSGGFTLLSYNGGFWTRSDHFNGGIIRYLASNLKTLSTVDASKLNGDSVRCLRD